MVLVCHVSSRVGWAQAAWRDLAATCPQMLAQGVTCLVASTPAQYLQVHPLFYPHAYMEVEG